MFLPIFSVFSAFIAVAGSAQTSRVLSACDVLADPHKYDGQTVTIQAMLVSSENNTDFDELAPLPSDRCYRPRRQARLRIALGSESMPAHPEGWKPDLDSYDQAAKNHE